MNFVVFSYNFLPLKDAESWCTARFVGSLAHCGHNVHVVTMDHAGCVSEDVFDLIVGAKVSITRVPRHKVSKPIISRMRYQTFEWEAVDFNACCKAVKVALKGMPSDAVLITRSNPLASTIVGWHCRKFAHKWVAHLSDPTPIPGREDSWKNTHGYINRFWMRRTLRDADIVSVTCPNAIRAFKDEYGALAGGVRFVVTPHIGEPALPQSQHRSSTDDGVIHVVHHGIICAGRGAPELAAAVEKLNASGVRCEFVQCGQVDDVAEVFEGNPFVYATDRCDADIEYIPDLMVPLDYCPFLSSKFVYRVFDENPILLRSRQDGFSAHLAQRYPDAGIVVATENDDMRVRLREAIALVGRHFNRAPLRQLFSRSEVVNAFTNNFA